MTNQAYMNVLKTETYGSEQDEKTRFIKIGVAFPHQSGNGFNLKITEGISVSGELVILPPKETANQAQS